MAKNEFAAGSTVHTQVGDFVAGSDTYNKYVAQTGDTGWQDPPKTATQQNTNTQQGTNTQQTATPQVVKQGSGGYASTTDETGKTSGYTGRFDYYQNGQWYTGENGAYYQDGKLSDAKVRDGAIIRTNGGNYLYRDPNKNATVNNNKLSQIPTNYGQANLDAWLRAAQQQANQSADYTTQQGIKELTRAEEDAQKQFQTQRNQIDIDEAKAKDNQALYAEARGDKGGIGAAQYDSIMNTAANNRAQVQKAQTQLSTDTARQIADLRAQGEFEKADALLTLTQSYLSQLISMEQFALNYNLSAAQFNASLDQWAEEYKLKVADLTGVYNGNLTLQGQQYQDNRNAAIDQRNANAGATLLESGIMPSDVQLAAMGYSREEAQAIIDAKTAADAKQSALAEVELALEAGYLIDEKTAAAAGLNYETIKGVHEAKQAAANATAEANAQKTASDKAEKQVTAMISAGKVPDESLCEQAGWDYNTCKILAEAEAAKAAKKGAGGDGKGKYNIDFASLYKEGVTPYTLASVLASNGVTDDLSDWEARYENWLGEDGMVDRSFQGVKSTIGRMVKEGEDPSTVVAYAESVSGPMSEKQWADIETYIGKLYPKS